MQVDFYILNTADLVTKWSFVARLTEKIYRQRLRVQLLLPNTASVEHLDALLWNYRADSFLPHEIINPDHPAIAPILLTHDASLLYPYEVLLTFVDLPGNYPTAIQRIVEVVCQNPEDLEASRSRYRQYQQAGHELKTHKI